MGRWLDPSEKASVVQWVKDLRDKLQPFAHGVYANQLGDTSEDLVRAAYGSNYARLVEIKKKYDPKNVLGSTRTSSLISRQTSSFTSPQQNLVIMKPYWLHGRRLPAFAAMRWFGSVFSCSGINPRQRSLNERSLATLGEESTIASGSSGGWMSCFDDGRVLNG